MPDKNPAADRWGGPGGGDNTKHQWPEPRVSDDGEGKAGAKNNTLSQREREGPTPTSVGG